MTFRSRALRLAALSLTLTFLTLHSAFAGTIPPLPAATESFDAGILHVDRFGSGKQTLILIPGLGCGAWVWSQTIARFSHDYTIYVVTLPGFDGYPATAQRPLFAAFSHDFWKMLDDRAIQSPVVVGHSLGGTLAITLGEQHAERLRGIVAVDGLPVFPTLAKATAAQRSAAAQQFAGAYAGMNSAQLLAGSKAYMSSIGTIDPALVAPAAALEARSDANAMAAWAQEDLSSDFRPELAKVTVPLLEVVPYEPRTSPYTQAQTLAFYQSLLSGAPHATVAPLAPSRHFAMLDRPEAFDTLLAGWLKTAGS